MHRAGHQFFADARLTYDQHGSAARSGSRNLLVHLKDRLASTHDFTFGAQLLSQLINFPPRDGKILHQFLLAVAGLNGQRHVFSDR